MLLSERRSTGASKLTRRVEVPSVPPIPSAETVLQAIEGGESVKDASSLMSKAMEGLSWIERRKLRRMVVAALEKRERAGDGRD